MVQSLPADVCSENVNVPRIGEFQRIADRHGNAVWLFTGRTSGAPDTQRTRAFPELLHVQLRQYPSLQDLENCGISEEGRLLCEEALQQGVIFDIGILDESQQVSAVRQFFRLDVLAHTTGKEAFARLIKQHSGTLLDQSAYLSQFMFANAQSGCLPQFAYRQRFSGEPQQLPIPAALRLQRLVKKRGTATAPR